MRMLRWMCGITRDRVRNVRGTAKVVEISKKMQETMKTKQANKTKTDSLHGETQKQNNEAGTSSSVENLSNMKYVIILSNISNDMTNPLSLHKVISTK